MAGKNRPDIDETKPLGVKIKRAAKLLDLCERSIRRHADNGVLVHLHRRLTLNLDGSNREAKEVRLSPTPAGA